MSGTLVDSSNLIQFLTTGEAPPPAGLTERTEKTEKPAAVEPKPAAASDATVAKTEVDDTQATAIEVEPEDVEGEDGLTPRQKRELTEKMRKAIGAKHRALKEAEEFAGDQYRERRLAEQRAERAERELVRLQAQAQPPSATEEVAAPARTNFASEQEYQDALIDFKVDQKLKVKQAEEATARQAAQMEAIRAQASARIAAAIEAVPDFTEVTEAADIEVPPYIAGYMQESELFAELGYHFAKHPDVLERLGKLSPAKALVEVGKLETTLKPFTAARPAKPNGHDTSASAPAVPIKPRAPAPITPVDSSGSQVERDPRDMTYEESKRDWERKKKVNLYARKRH
jgi:hypothetical protein